MSALGKTLEDEIYQDEEIETARQTQPAGPTETSLPRPSIES